MEMLCLYQYGFVHLRGGHILLNIQKQLNFIVIVLLFRYAVIKMATAQKHSTKSIQCSTGTN